MAFAFANNHFGSIKLNAINAANQYQTVNYAHKMEQNAPNVNRQIVNQTFNNHNVFVLTINMKINKLKNVNFVMFCKIVLHVKQHNLINA